MNDAAITIDHVHKSFGRTQALKNVAANIARGRITGLVGPDGAGKTTLIRLMAGLMMPDKGRITVWGFDSVNDSNRIHDIIGYMPQKFGLYEDLTVRENLELYARLKNLQGEEKDKAFQRMLSFTALEPFTKRLAGDLSGGMKQKLGLACALLAHPEVLLLDEPSVGVDPVSRRELWKMVGDLAREGIAVIWSTAYLDEAERCDHVLLLNEGSLIFSGAPDELTKRAEGRSFYFPAAQADRRHALMEILRRPGVIDATIQGKGVRVVLAEGAGPQDTGVDLKPVASRFEDAFVDILGGGPGGELRIAELVKVEGNDGQAPIEARKLTKRFGDFTAARDIEFSVKRGEIFGLLGPNGAGKSTTFKMLCGLLQPTQGRALVSGFDLKTSTSAARERIGYMAQKFSLYGDMSVKQNLDFFSGVYGLTGKARRDKIEEMVEIFELSSYLDSNAGGLPLGFKQRLALACAVMHEPEVLFLDEPTSGVDPITRREFWLHINSLAQKGVTVMVTTHFMDEAEYCDRIALIYQGENIATGTPDDLKEQAASKDMPDPTLEDAFIALIQRRDEEKQQTEGSMTNNASSGFSRQRFLAFMRKEMLQVWRDPSSILIALVLPLILVFLFGYGVSLDANTVRIGVALEDSSPEARSLAYAFQQSKYFDAKVEREHRGLEDDLVASKLRGVVIIPQDFTRKLHDGRQAEVMVIADGSETNTAGILQGYAEGTVNTWLAARLSEQTTPDSAKIPGISPAVRVWFNPELKTRNTLLPGSLAIIMSMIGTLLTALVISREWERGTMEAMMATSLRIHEMLIAKLVPYFLLGLGSMTLCVALSIFVFGVPFRGSLLVLLMSTCVFLLCALGQGLLISTAARSQFVASQIALLTAYLPAFMLSGFLFEISSMPLPLRAITYILPARYFVAIMQTSFLAGNVWPLFWQNMAAMAVIAAVMLTWTARRAGGRLD